ncbi:MAG: Holliday junction branch migration protein RuvA [Candidatus Dadabacteria bacterium]|nr:MAG: Holliday junction branch migration protein RuvA [Candidatus Dadabacteria bacterium]
MIARLRGRLLEKSPAEVVVDCSGVGYRAQVSLATYARLPEPGDPVDLFAVTHLRDNAIELFAFADRRERALFNLLRGVSGVGPRLALAILSGIDADELARVLHEGRPERLIAIPGVGRKTAERVVLELREKVPAVETAGGADGIERDAILALVSLGYKEHEAARAVRASRSEAGGTVEELIKASLARMH